MSRRAHLLAGFASLLALAGCGLLTAPKTLDIQYFVLDALSPPTGVKSHLAIGLGPVTLPAYLDRPELARRVDENEIAYTADVRWAEPLKSTFERTIAANLVQLLAPERLLTFPWFRNAELDFTVNVAATRFEQQPDGDVMLAARWMVRDRHDAPVAVETSVLTRPGGRPTQNAAALSSLVAELSQAIADRIQAAPPVH